MRILTIVDKEGSAICRLAEMVQKNNEHLDIEVLPFHPKRYSQGDLDLFEEKAKEADLIDFQYWKNAMVLLEKFPWVKSKPIILTHHNPYNLHEHTWEEFDKVIVKNEYQLNELPEARLIRHGVDMDFLEYNEDYTSEEYIYSKVVGMVAFRIESKKGIKEVAQACKDLGYKFLLVGHVSKPDYMKEVMEVGGDSIEFRENVTDEELKQAYREMDIHVCNSIDGFESGTMPILEAMASGVPVLTREIGLVPDVFSGGNMAVRKGESTDVEDLKKELKALMEDRDRRENIRARAWQSVRAYSHFRMAKEYAKLYNDVLYPLDILASVIIPTYNRKAQVLEILESLEGQTYKNIEVVVCDDNSTDGTESAVKGMREKVKYPIKYVNTEKEGYNLAMARNLGVIEADGDALVFIDSRLKPEPSAIQIFVSQVMAEKVWLFGEKGGGKRSFVENFSAISRDALIKSGMFCERIDSYGGMSQELRKRFTAQGYEMRYIAEARAEVILRAKKASKKRKDTLRMKNRLYSMGLQ